MARGIRIWRFQQADNAWLYRNRRGEETLRAPADVGHTGAQPGHGDWLFEEKGANEDVPEQVATTSILAFVKNEQIPADATVWVYEDESFHRIYHRSTATANVKDPPAHVQAVGSDCENRDLVIDRGAGVAPRQVSRGDVADVELHVAEGEVQLDGVDTGITQEQLLHALGRTFQQEGRRIERAIHGAARALDENDASTFEECSAALLESLAGAAPGPVGGTNYIHQINQAVEDTSKVILACEDSSSATWDASGSTGQFGGGVMSVDHTWQALASVLSAALDVFQIQKLYHEQKSSSPDHAVDLKKLRRGRYASLGTNLMKSYTTIGTSVGTISTLASSSGATILGTGTAASLPGVGAVTGLATMIRSSWQSEKSRRRAKTLKALQKAAENGSLDAKTQALLEFAIGKAMRKHRFKAVEATVAGGSMASSTALAIGAAVAGANAWNPVGWGIGAVCIVAGGGLLSYKIYRRARSKRRARKRGFESAKFPEILVQTYVKCFRSDSDSVDTLTLAGVLESYGVNPTWLQLSSAAEYRAAQGRIQDAISRIERHLR